MDPGWVAALTALVVAVFTGAGWMAARAWRIVRRVVHFLDDYAGRPAADGRAAVPGFMARLGSVEEQLAHVVAETSPNHGRSIRDLVLKTADDVAEMRSRLEGRGSP